MRELIIARLKSILDNGDELYSDFDYETPIENVEQLIALSDEDLLNTYDNVIGFDG